MKSGLGSGITSKTPRKLEGITDKPQNRMEDMSSCTAMICLGYDETPYNQHYLRGIRRSITWLFATTASRIRTPRVRERRRGREQKPSVQLLGGTVQVTIRQSLGKPEDFNIRSGIIMRLRHSPTMSRLLVLEMVLCFGITSLV